MSDLERWVLASRLVASLRIDRRLVDAALDALVPCGVAVGAALDARVRLDHGAGVVEVPAGEVEA